MLQWSKHMHHVEACSADREATKREDSWIPGSTSVHRAAVAVAFSFQLPSSGRCLLTCQHTISVAYLLPGIESVKDVASHRHIDDPIQINLLCGSCRCYYVHHPCPQKRTSWTSSLLLGEGETIKCPLQWQLLISCWPLSLHYQRQLYAMPVMKISGVNRARQGK